MSGPYLMGLDVGGGGGRCLLLDVADGSVTRGFRAWSFPAAPAAGPGAVDADLGRIWHDLAAAAAEARESAGAPPEAIAGVAVTAMRLGAVVLDAAGATLYAAPNRDARAAPFGFAIAAQHGEALLRRTGRWPLPISAAARLRWLAESDPAAFERADSFLSLNDWVAFHLCGGRATDFSQAGESFLFGLEERAWDWEWIGRLELPRRIFPAVHAAGTQLGQARAEAAAELGVAPGTPVGVGGGDTQCGLLGVGADRADAAAIVAGTTAPIQLLLDRPLVDPDGRLWAGQHVVPGLWNLESNAGMVGESIDWLARLLAPGESDPVPTLLAEAERAPPGAAGCLSTFGAQLHDARSVSHAIGGLRLPRLALPDGAASRPHLARAVTEGVAHALRANLDGLRRLADPILEEVRLTGGLSRSADFAQLLADVLDLPVTVGRTAESSALGAALCAGVAAGLLPDLPTGVRLLAGAPRHHLPDPGRAGLYAEQHARWLRLREAESAAEAIAQESALAAASG